VVLSISLSLRGRSARWSPSPFFFLFYITSIKAELADKEEYLDRVINCLLEDVK
jgi:hypothetical protein